MASMASIAVAFIAMFVAFGAVAEPKVISTNQGVIDKYHAKHGAARAFIELLEREVKHMGDLVDRPMMISEMGGQSREMSRLADQGREFGESVFEEPFGRCFAAGVDAQFVWDVIRNVKMGRPLHGASYEKAKARFYENAKECRNAVKKGPPAPMAVVEISNNDQRPPYRGCKPMMSLFEDEGERFSCPMPLKP